MLLDGLIKHQCPFRAVARAVFQPHIIAHLQFLRSYLNEAQSVACGKLGRHSRVCRRPELNMLPPLSPSQLDSKLHCYNLVPRGIHGKPVWSCSAAEERTSTSTESAHRY